MLFALQEESIMTEWSIVICCVSVVLQINLLIGEPFYTTSTLPWHNLHFLYARSELGSLLAPDCKVLPVAVTFKAIAVEFEHLWKIRSAVGECEGFNLATFDSLIEVYVI